MSMRHVVATSAIRGEACIGLLALEAAMLDERRDNMTHGPREHLRL